MDKMKLLNLFIFAFAVSLMVQLIFFPAKDTTTVQAGVLIQIKDDTITVPNIPVIDILNQSSGSITVNPCTDVTISHDTRGDVNDIPTMAPEFCNPITIVAG